MELSLSSGWIDEDGSIYLIYSNSSLMELLGCSKSKLLSIKKSLGDFAIIEEVQQSSSEKGRLVNKIYLGELEHEPTPVLNSDGGGVKKTQSQSQNQTGPVLISATSETEILTEDEEENGLTRKVEKNSPYDKDYIWGLVHDQFRRESFTQASAEFVMRHFETRYQ